MDGNLQRRAGAMLGRHVAIEASESRAGGARASCHADDLTVLVRAVETEVIPRLLNAHKTSTRGVRLPSMADVEEMAGHALDSDAPAAHRQIASLIEDGVSVEAVYLNLLAATARMLGEMWEQDRVNFIDVTVGLCTLHQVLFRLGPDDGDDSGSARRALFAPVPGETHVFGALIVARFFTRAGWRSWTEIASETGILLDLVRRHDFDVVGLSIACDRHVETLRDTVAALRRVRPEMAIIIGGHAVDLRADLAADVGADAGASDAPQAVAIADSLVDKARVNA